MARRLYQNNVDVSKNKFGPRQRGRGLVGVVDVGVVYSPSTMCTASMFLLPVTGHPVPCVRFTVSVDLSLCH